MLNTRSSFRLDHKSLEGVHDWNYPTWLPPVCRVSGRSSQPHVGVVNYCHVQNVANPPSVTAGLLEETCNCCQKAAKPGPQKSQASPTLITVYGLIWPESSRNANNNNNYYYYYYYCYYYDYYNYYWCYYWLLLFETRWNDKPKQKATSNLLSGPLGMALFH